MAYDEEILRRARQRFDAQRQERRAALESRRQSVYRRQPRIREIDAELCKTSARVLSAALRYGDPRQAVAQLREKNLNLQAEKKSLLAQLRLPLDYLKDQPACPVCRDSGYTDDGHMCWCLKKLCAQEQKKDLSKMLDLDNQSFENFSLDWYSDRTDKTQGISPRKYMEHIYKECLDYARKFGAESGNLFFFGSSGLGKTFLSAAIAREVSAAGFSVVYDTAAHVFQQFEAERFNREADAPREVSRVLHCDLLILDDLSADMPSQLMRSALYQIVNTRLIERRATILSTNLEPTNLEKYSPQIASRVQGEYEIFGFFGEDIRQLKRKYHGKPPYGKRPQGTK